MTVEANLAPFARAQDLTALPARFLFRIDIQFHPVQSIQTGVGTRMVFAARQGKLTGPGIEAEVMPASADWLVVGTDNVARIDVRASLRTTDDEYIFMTNTGRVDLGAHAVRFLAGEMVTADEAYIRTAPLFDTTAERYRHLSAITAMAYCDLSLHEIQYRIYALN